MPEVTLADFQKAADEKFGDFTVRLADDKVATFSQAMRLPKAKRAKLAAAVDLQTRVQKAEAEDSDEDIYDIYKDAFKVCAVKASDYKMLADAVGDDPAVWVDLFNAFMEKMMVGEASPSES